jgi:hypothetical protein
MLNQKPAQGLKSIFKKQPKVSKGQSRPMNTWAQALKKESK